METVDHADCRKWHFGKWRGWHLKLIVFSESDDLLWRSVMFGLFGRTPLAFVFSSRALGSFNLSCQQRNPQVIESQTWVCWDTYKTVYSNGPILCRYLIATSKASMRSVNRDRGSGAWVWGPETQPTLPLEIITKRCLLFLCAACQTESAQINCF